MDASEIIERFQDQAEVAYRWDNLGPGASEERLICLTRGVVQWPLRRGIRLGGGP